MILAYCLSATQYFLIDVVNKVFMPFGVITFAAGMFMFLFRRWSPACELTSSPS